MMCFMFSNYISHSGSQLGKMRHTHTHTHTNSYDNNQYFLHDFLEWKYSISRERDNEGHSREWSGYSIQEVPPEHQKDAATFSNPPSYSIIGLIVSFHIYLSSFNLIPSSTNFFLYNSLSVPLSSKSVVPRIVAVLFFH